MLKWSTMLDLLRGAGITVTVSCLAIAAGVPLGLLLALARTRRAGGLRWLSAVYSSFVRAAPVVTFTMLIFFGLPAIGVSLDPLPAAVIALTLNTAAFNAEIWRAAIMDFPRGQLEAALAMGMTGRVAFRRIVFIKASPAIAIIGVVDLTRKARQIAATTYEPLPPFVAAAVVYGLALALLVAGARTLERSLRRRYGTL